MFYFFGLVRIEQRVDAAYSVNGNNNFTDRLMSDQDTCWQKKVFIFIIIIIITLGAEIQQAKYALELQHGLFQHN